MSGTIVMAPLTGLVRALADVPDAVFAGGLMGPGVAIDPIGDTLHAPVDGFVTALHAARHAVTIETADGVSLLVHLGIDTVSLGGAGIDALVEVGRRVDAGTPLLRFDLDRLVREATAIVTPVIATADGARVVPLAEGIVSAGTPLFRVEQDAVAAPARVENARAVRTVTVALPHGIHARPAAAIAAAARAHDVAMTLIHGERRAAATSMTGLLGLGAGHGAPVTIEAQGRDPAGAIDAVEAVLTDAAAEAPLPAVPLVPVPADDDAAGLRAVPAAPGLAIGPALRWRRAAIGADDRPYEGVPAERVRLSTALDRVRRDLTRDGGAAGARGAVLSAHLAMLDDPALVDAMDAAIAAGAGAAQACRDAVAAQVAWLGGAGDAHIAARVDDLRDVEARLLTILAGGEAPAAVTATDAIVLSDDLLPSEVVALADGGAAGFVLAGGGPTSHAAILAAGAGLPMVVAAGAALAQIDDGTLLILDADRGQVEPAPSAGRLEAARARIDRARAATAHDGRPIATRDGTRVELFANLGSRGDAEAALAAGAEGCGLLRTEFLFLDRATPPDAAEQEREYRAIATILRDRPMILRLLDVGGDKPAPYLAMPAEENPALGVRGVRVSLAHPALLDAQLSAAIASGCRIMVPMVSDLAEVEAVIARAVALGGDASAIGVMIETPAAAMTADLLAARVAFLSIGTNDLTQYALAMDRGNPAVAAGIDGLHPAVLRLIERTCAGAEHHGTPVGVCGGLAADALAVPILLGLGVRELSMPPARLGAIRAAVRGVDLPAARRHAHAMLALPSAAAVRDAAARFAGDGE